MSNNTRMMADAIAQGINEVDPNVAVKIFNVARSDKNEILDQRLPLQGGTGGHLHDEQRDDSRKLPGWWRR